MTVLFILAILAVIAWELLFYMPQSNKQGDWLAEVWIHGLGIERVRFSARYTTKAKAVRAAKAGARRLDYLGSPVPVHREFGIMWGVRKYTTMEGI